MVHIIIYWDKNLLILQKYTQLQKHNFYYISMDTHYDYGTPFKDSMSLALKAPPIIKG